MVFHSIDTQPELLSHSLVRESFDTAHTKHTAAHGRQLFYSLHDLTLQLGSGADVRG